MLKTGFRPICRRTVEGPTNANTISWCVTSLDRHSCRMGSQTYPHSAHIQLVASVLSEVHSRFARLQRRSEELHSHFRKLHSHSEWLQSRSAILHSHAGGVAFSSVNPSRHAAKPPHSERLRRPECAAPLALWRRRTQSGHRHFSFHFKISGRIFVTRADPFPKAWVKCRSLLIHQTTPRASGISRA